jgi:hypothetical protein
VADPREGEAKAVCPMKQSGEHTRALVSGVQRSNDLSLGPTILVRHRLLPFCAKLQRGVGKLSLLPQIMTPKALTVWGLLSRGSVQSGLTSRPRGVWHEERGDAGRIGADQSGACAC